MASEKIRAETAPADPAREHTQISEYTDYTEDDRNRDSHPRSSGQMADDDDSPDEESDEEDEEDDEEFSDPEIAAAIKASREHAKADKTKAKEEARAAKRAKKSGKEPENLGKSDSQMARELEANPSDAEGDAAAPKPSVGGDSDFARQLEANPTDPSAGPSNSRQPSYRQEERAEGEDEDEDEVPEEDGPAARRGARGQQSAASSAVTGTEGSSAPRVSNRDFDWRDLVWNCQICTAENSAARHRCEMCNTRRPEGAELRVPDDYDPEQARLRREERGETGPPPPPNMEAMVALDDLIGNNQGSIYGGDGNHNPDGDADDIVVCTMCGTSNPGNVRNCVACTYSVADSRREMQAMMQQEEQRQTRQRDENRRQKEMEDTRRAGQMEEIARLNRQHGITPPGQGQGGSSSSSSHQNPNVGQSMRDDPRGVNQGGQVVSSSRPVLRPGLTVIAKEKMKWRKNGTQMPVKKTGSKFKVEAGSVGVVISTTPVLRVQWGKNQIGEAEERQITVGAAGQDPRRPQGQMANSMP